MKTTIKDIAKDTNLSLATISKYLNGKNVLPENKKRIEASIAKLNYSPNKSAQSLRSHKTYTISILIPDISDYFWGTLCSYIEEALRKYGYSTIICSYDETLTENTINWNFLFSKQVDGIIFIPHPFYKPFFPEPILNHHIPLIYLDQKIKNSKMDLITSTNEQGAYKATKYLLERGHHYIGVIGGPAQTYTICERLNGFKKACNDYHIPIKEQLIYCNEFTVQWGMESFRSLMQALPRPTALLSLGHDAGLGIILEASAQNICIPENISLITFDDDEIFAATIPPITVISQNLKEMGKQAASLLIKRINNNYSSFPETTLIETVLLERNSVKTLK